MPQWRYFVFGCIKQTRLASGVSTLEGAGFIMHPAFYVLYTLRLWLAQNARAYTSACSTGFCVIRVFISPSSSSISYSGASAQPPAAYEAEIIKFPLKIPGQ
jgi:hypothetical protein